MACNFQHIAIKMDKSLSKIIITNYMGCKIILILAQIGFFYPPFFRHSAAGRSLWCTSNSQKKNRWLQSSLQPSKLQFFSDFTACPAILVWTDYIPILRSPRDSGTIPLWCDIKKGGKQSNVSQSGHFTTFNPLEFRWPCTSRQSALSVWDDP